MHYLSAGCAIEARLKEIAAIKDVLSGTELSRLQDKAIRSPSCFVVYAGDKAVELISPNMTKVTQMWLVVLAVRFANEAAKTRQEAGELMSEVMLHLNGFNPLEGADLRLQPSPPPDFSNSIGFYPMAYSLDVNVRSGNCN